MDYTESRQGTEAEKRSYSNRLPVAALRSAFRPIARFAVALWLVFCQYGCASLVQTSQSESAGDPVPQATEPAPSGRGASAAGVALSRAAALIGDAVRTVAGGVAGALKGTALGAVGGAVFDAKAGGATFPIGTVIGAAVGATIGAVEGAREGLRTRRMVAASDPTDAPRPTRASAQNGDADQGARDERIPR